MLEFHFIVIIATSMVAIISNLLAIILPNISFCYILSYKQKEKKDTFKLEQPFTSQIPFDSVEDIIISTSE